MNATISWTQRQAATRLGTFRPDYLFAESPVLLIAIGIDLRNPWPTGAPRFAERTEHVSISK